MLRKRLILAAVCLGLVCGCSETQTSEVNIWSGGSSQSENSSDEEQSGGSESASSTSEESSAPAPVENPTVTLLCAGDNLLHQNVLNQAKRHGGGDDYNFLPMYDSVKDIIAAADLAVLNQETIISDDFEPSGYPNFCSPTQLGDQMVELGFDAFSISNNHVLDKGVKGLKSTVEYWKTKHPEQVVYGAGKFSDFDDIPVMDVNGITFAFVGFTEHTNGIPIPEGSEYGVIYLSDSKRVEELIRKADSLADVVVVSPHFGVEVSGTVSATQKQQTKEFVEWGADIIIGTQPHTVQSMEWVTKPDGGQAFVFYCLGNLISSMDVPLGMEGILGRIKITKDLKTGKITLSDPEAIPIITHYDSGWQNVRIYLWEEYTRELAAKHRCPSFSYDFAAKVFEREMKIVDYLP